MEDESSRVFRGGSWGDLATTARVAIQSASACGYHNALVGVRLVLVINPFQQIAEVSNGK